MDVEALILQPPPTDTHKTRPPTIEGELARRAQPAVLIQYVRYLPAARLSASLILSCQPGPDSWKYSSTS
jgi:hypothetical protein